MPWTHWALYCECHTGVPWYMVDWQKHPSNHFRMLADSWFRWNCFFVMLTCSVQFIKYIYKWCPCLALSIQKGNYWLYLKNYYRKINVMYTILDGKSFDVGGHWQLWRVWKHRMTTQKRRKSNAKKVPGNMLTKGCSTYAYSYQTWISYVHWTLLKTCLVVTKLDIADTS